MKTEELKPVRCGCGGEAKVITCAFGNAKMVLCGRCGMRTVQATEAKAIEAWNRAMSGNVQECAKDARCNERTAKVIEHDASVTDTDGYKYHRSEYLCGACKKKVIGGDDYCSHCGARLEWDE